MKTSSMEVASEISFSIFASHLMGEGITQQNLQDNHQKVSNGVLFATIPSFRLQLLMSYPYLMINTPGLMKKTFFSPAFPD
ncbi:unnamed protein product [Rhizophagus irregularis]|nr:unnamed protein product [Rhizophagus irregularis]